MTRRGWLLFSAMCLLWGIPYLLIKVAVADMSPAVLVVGRTGIGALVLLPFAAKRGMLRPLLRTGGRSMPSQSLRSPARGCCWPTRNDTWPVR